MPLPAVTVLRYLLNLITTQLLHKFIIKKPNDLSYDYLIYIRLLFLDTYSTLQSSLLLILLSFAQKLKLSS